MRPTPLERHARDAAGPQAAVSNPSESPWHQEHMAHTVGLHRQSGHKTTVIQFLMGSPMLRNQLRSKGSIGRYYCFKPGKWRGCLNWDLRFSLTFLHLFYGSAFPKAELITWAWCKSLEGWASSWERDHVLPTVGGCVVWSFFLIRGLKNLWEGAHWKTGKHIEYT